MAAQPPTRRARAPRGEYFQQGSVGCGEGRHADRVSATRCRAAHVYSSADRCGRIATHALQDDPRWVWIRTRLSGLSPANRARARRVSRVRCELRYGHSAPLGLSRSVAAGVRRADADAGRRQPASSPRFSGDSADGSNVTVGTRMTAKIVQLTLSPTSLRTSAASVLLDSARFSSLCPTCNDTRSQLGYTARTLSRLLGRNRPIEAYCVICNAFWPISAAERARLAAELRLARI